MYSSKNKLSFTIDVNFPIPMQDDQYFYLKSQLLYL